MKIRITFTIDVDPDAWTEEFGTAHNEIRDNVLSWARAQVELELNDRGLLHQTH